jgi:hypothetical protein
VCPARLSIAELPAQQYHTMYIAFSNSNRNLPSLDNNNLIKLLSETLCFPTSPKINLFDVVPQFWFIKNPTITESCFLIFSRVCWKKSYHLLFYFWGGGVRPVFNFLHKFNLNDVLTFWIIINCNLCIGEYELLL